MDRLEAMIVAVYTKRFNDVRRQRPEDEDEYYRRHAPKPFRPVPAVSLLVVIGFAVIAFGFISA